MQLQDKQLFQVSAFYTELRELANTITYFRSCLNIVLRSHYHYKTTTV